jgi:hypothetical protein
MPRVRRQAVGIEIEERYCAAAEKRLSALMVWLRPAMHSTARDQRTARTFNRTERPLA